MSLDDFDNIFPKLGGDGCMFLVFENKEKIITLTSTYEDHYKYSCTIICSPKFVEKKLELYGLLSLIILEKPLNVLDSYASKTKFIIHNHDGSCLEDYLGKFLKEYDLHLHGLDILLRKKLPTHNEGHIINSFFNITPKIEEIYDNIIIEHYAALN